MFCDVRGLFWDVLGCSGMFWHVLGYTGMYLDVLGCSGMYWDVLESVFGGFKVYEVPNVG